MAVTVAELRSLKAGNLKREDGKRIEWLPDDGKRGAGTLLFRAVGGIIRGYFRYAPATSKRDTLAIGQWDEKGRDGMTLDEIRAKANEWRRLYQSGVKDIRACIASEKQSREASKQAEERARVEAEQKIREREQYTLGALCDAYVRLLGTKGKTKSARDTASCFKVHVPEDLARLPANEITPHQVAAMVRKVRENGKERTAGILRSYLRAAYGAAIRAPFDSELPADLIPFNVESNPVDAVPAIAVRAGDRTLSRNELRQYMAHLGNGIIDQALLLALLAGGQRMAQLLRARVADWDGGTLRLWDGKGKRVAAREHLLPLGPRSAALVDSLILRAQARTDDPNPSLWLSIGEAQIVGTTPGKRVAKIAVSMKGEPFDLRDIRRTVETQMAGLRLSRDIRAQLLSHGISGVQAIHYDRYDYIEEKRAALIVWERHLEAIQTGETNPKVIEMRRAG